jgi:hypothetical protein
VKKLLLATSALAASLVTAQATEFDFNDIYGVTSSATYQSLYGSTTPGYGGTGFYQLSQFSNAPYVIKLGTGPSISFDYAPNTNAQQALALFGFGQTVSDGQQVGSIYNTSALTGTSVSFRSYTAGFYSNFTFNSFDLSSAVDNTIIISGIAGNGTYIDSATIQLSGGGGFTTFNEDWSGVSIITLLALNQQAVGTVSMDNVRINEAVSPVPGPIVGAGLPGLLGCLFGWNYFRNFFRRRRFIANAQRSLVALVR